MAVIVAINAVRRRLAANGANELEEEKAEEVLGSDADSHISVKELMTHLDQVVVCADRMEELLRLEADLLDMVWKLPGFCVCLVCFMMGLIEFSPAGAGYDIHRHLHTHFNLDRLLDIADFNGIYEYMEEFEHHNEELQATSFRYWCEGRYAVHRWSEDYMVPMHSCPSPRLYALGLLTDPAFKWSLSSNSSGSGSGSSGRLLASSAGGDGSVVRSAPPCIDDEVHLRSLTGDPTASCPAYAVDPHHLACEHDMGLHSCRLTCGFCGPFEYHHMKKFERPQVTMLPVMVYQTRFVKTDCHGFAATYEQQPYNPVLSLMPALDGPRTAGILTCIDRSTHQESDYAMELDCTDDTPPSSCIDGKVPVTLKHTFHGDIVYPKLLIEPHRDVIRMKQVEWVDLQTDVVSLSTMIYTEAVEVFTSLTVDFVMDAAGNVDGSFKMISYRDLVGTPKAIFLGCMIACIVVAFFGAACSCFHLVRQPADEKRGGAIYELFSRLLFFVYPTVLLIQWSQQIPMSVEFDHLLHSFLDLPGLDEHELEVGVQKYFDTKSIIYEETSWLFRNRVVAYLVCYVELLQLIFYFNAHPKMAFLTATVHRALGNIAHFMAVFGILYLMLAFMGHWMLGPYIQAFGTFGSTLATQVQMIYGEFIKADGVDMLDGSMLAMYWIYSGTFMLLVIWTLMNFFLAIIVDSFVEVKEANTKNIAARDFLSDVRSALSSLSLSSRKKWPPRRALIDFFHDVVEEAASGQDGKTLMEGLMSQHTEEGGAKHSYVTPARMQEVFHRFDKRGAAVFLLHYYVRYPAVLVPLNRTSTLAGKRSKMTLKQSLMASKQSTADPPSAAPEQLEAQHAVAEQPAPCAEAGEARGRADPEEDVAAAAPQPRPQPGPRLEL